MWVLGSEPGFSGKVVVLLATERALKFWKTMVFKSNRLFYAVIFTWEHGAKQEKKGYSLIEICQELYFYVKGSILLDSYLSTWHKLGTSEKREPQLTNVSIRYPDRQLHEGILLINDEHENHPWVGRLELYKKNKQSESRRISQQAALLCQSVLVPAWRFLPLAPAQNCPSW